MRLTLQSDEQVVGRQRILLISPDQAFKGLYPYPTHHLYDRFSMVNFEKPRLDIWPKFENVRGRVAILSPGDVLYIPPFWYVPLKAALSSFAL